MGDGPNNDPVRVLAYADSRLFSGAEAVHCELVRGLKASAAIELRCAAPLSNRTLAERLREIAGEDPIDVPSQRPSAAAFDLYSPRRRAAVDRALSGVDFDVLLVNLPSAEYGATPLAAHSLHAKSIGVLHVPGSPRSLGFRLGGARERLAKHALRRLDAVCVLTESAADDFRALWNGNGSTVGLVRLPKPTLERVDRVAARAELGLPDGTVVGIAGRVSFKQKGQDTFVAAAELLLAERPELRFAVAGDGRDLDRLRHLIQERDLSAGFHLLGRVDPIERFLSAVDAIAIPSTFEGLPLIALEALTLGVPGVAISVDGLRDVWPVAWQVEHGDPSALARGLARVLDAPPEERAAAIEEGRRLMDANTSDDPARALEAQILELAGRGKTAA